VDIHQCGLHGRLVPLIDSCTANKVEVCND